MIRIATKRDANTIAALIQNHGRTENQRKLRENLTTAWATALRDQDTTVYVSIYGADIDGVLCVKHLKPKQETIITDLFVAAAKRRNGIGRSLLAAALKSSDNCGHETRLFTSKSNKPAIALYRCFGFQDIIGPKTNMNPKTLCMVRAPQPLNNHP